ncbi:MAG: hypothetical protein QE267_09535 [Akkermansiaceae bacterium]|nr:hypothetical protein [Akkermansiaceae bacterium]
MKLHFLYVNIAAVILLQGADAATPRFLYSKERLVMTADSFCDALGAFTLAQLPDPQPKCQAKLTDVTTPLTRRMWAIALDDLEHNLVTNEHGTYFAAGTRYTDRIYTRDISITGILGANRFYPKQMKDSLMLTRVNMKALGYQVSKSHLVSEIDAPWKVIAEEDKEIMAEFKTNSYTRRTDDVVWMWAAHDLFTLHPELADWKWFHQNGSEFFKDFYGPWFDASDGLYRGQPLFHDITNSAYPKGMTIADCVLLKSLTTNCLYYKAMLSMADASTKIGLQEAEKQEWLSRAAALKKVIVKEFTNADGTLAYYKDRHGVVMPNRDILGIALAVILGVVDGDAAKAAYAGYPESDLGVPLFSPFIPGNKGPHNQAVWPFTVSFYFWGKSLAYGEDYSAYNAAILARSLGTAFEDLPKKRKTDGKDWGTALGSFHEKINLPSGKIDGSGHQLWSAAAFLKVCILAGLIQE